MRKVPILLNALEQNEEIPLKRRRQQEITKFSDETNQSINIIIN